MKARFPIFARLENAARPVLGMLTVDRERGLVSVRPKRRRREYVMPIDDLAVMMVQSLLKLEAREKLKAKKLQRRNLHKARVAK